MAVPITLAELQAEHATESDAFHAELGKAIGRWSSVEWALYGIYAYAIGTPGSGPARAAFYANHAFYAKLEMVEQAFMVSFGKTELNEFWPEIAEKARKRSLVRNHLAHTPVTFAPQQPKGRRLFINVGAVNPASHPMITGRQGTMYFLHDLQKVNDSFMKLASDIATFEYRIERLLAGKPIK